MTDTDVTEKQALTGIEAVKAALAARVPGERTLAWVAKQLGISRAAPGQWDDIPEKHIKRIAEITGVSPSVLRPDLAELFASETAGS